ncbi:hypothetical protein CgunFtcFv8_009120 [Champsocephalus gunnari]|uniref:Uncharacterized protein n=1 Tax=Champsocephalus gunnari TaxID=52237 RepID=A0AAN8D3Q9_CHAGU|nr:hypothetical protein CgunFtcFv8_009120 [Champsocephalus gunnari]
MVPLLFPVHPEMTCLVLISGGRVERAVPASLQVPGQTSRCPPDAGAGLRVGEARGAGRAQGLRVCVRPWAWLCVQTLNAPQQH